jgi:hypothetical protein
MSFSAAQISASGDISVPEQSRLEEMLKSSVEQPHLQHRHTSMVPKDVGTELFGVSSDINDSYNMKFYERMKVVVILYACVCMIDCAMGRG